MPGAGLGTVGASGPQRRPWGQLSLQALEAQAMAGTRALDLAAERQE